MKKLPFKSNIESWSAGLLVLGAISIAALFLIIPLLAVFVEAFRGGIEQYFKAIGDPDAQSALRLTVTTAIWAVSLNTLFGVAAAWLIARFQFKGRKFLITLIDTPLAVSPVIAGMIFVLVFGVRGLFGPYLQELGIQIIFSEPGIILATTFVTLPFIVRELVPLMMSQGYHDEEAALTMGASPWQMFWLVTLPNIKWALFYGMILCAARAMGEFGAVSVVSGHIRGQTNTLPLHIEILYNEYNFSAAFAVSSILALLAVITLLLKEILERRDPLLRSHTRQ